MASGISDDGAVLFMEALLGITPISEVWVALCTDEPGVAMDGTILATIEPTDAAYARQSYAFGALTWGLSGHFATNLNPINFPTPGADWGLINHYALLTASSAGTLYAFGEFFEPQFIAAGWDVVIPEGGLILSIGRQYPAIQV